MENQANSKSIIINYGLYFGAASVLLSLVLYALGKHLEQGFGIMAIGFAIMIAFVVLGIKKFKSINNGYVSWGQAVKIGVGLVVVGSIITVIYQQVFMNFIEPDFLDQVAQRTEQTLLDAGLNDEQIESQIEMQKKFQSPAISIPLGIVMSAFFGFIVSAIAGAIMKKTEEEQY